MLFTSHNMAEVEEMCDDVMFINDGKIIARDKPENLSREIPTSEVEFITKSPEISRKFLEKEKISFKQIKNTFKIVINTKKISAFLISMANAKVEYDDIAINKPNLEDYFLKMAKGDKK